MSWLLPVLPGLACAAMMLFICVPMLMHRKDESGDSVSREEVDALREEIARLKADGTSAASEDVRV